jgi:predicted metal-dependent hydrolase
MSGKASRISALWSGVDPRGRDVRYAAYFHHFNRRDYYEAHDVLESLWLEGGREARNAAFFQGLIQLAGGFVHMRKHFENPEHRVHRERLGPAYRLLELAEKNMKGYGESWEGVSVEALCQLAKNWRGKLESQDFRRNPWNPEQGVALSLPTPPI